MNNIYTSVKYIKWYFGIILNAKQRIFDTEQYYETHHITPRSLGGANDHDNLVKLTAREHFICHRLLVKITSGTARHKMINAVWMMSSGNNGYNEKYIITSRTYEIIRRQFSLSRSESMKGSNNHMYGKTQTLESRKKISEFRMGKICTEETRKKISAANIGRKLPSPTEDTKKRMSESHKGQIPWNKGKSSWNKGIACSAETKRKLSERMKNKNKL